MKNRHERRKAAESQKKPVLFIDEGTIAEDNPVYGTQTVCYVCGIPHKAFGVAAIRLIKGTVETRHLASLCESCRADNNISAAIARKFLGAPDLTISEGGALTNEQVKAIVEKQDETEH